MKKIRDKAFQKIHGSIQTIQKYSPCARHIRMEESADRKFIKNYVLSCIPYIKENPEILEFDGGVVYADLIINEKGGSVSYATKVGRLNRNNPITYQFDLTKTVLDKKFDLIIATQVLGSFVDPLKIMRQFMDMLKPSGVLIVTVSGPAYPQIRGLISFYSKEGLTQIGREVFKAKNVINIRSYGNLASAICMLNYLSNEITNNIDEDEDYNHEVINGILCVNS
ncbi:methyltransferase domain-containing protein [Lachnospiraceae bacterium C1.1]|nr:methyltransferase domain-containing protein [Lachnospiraceae bacterium C1.1]